MVVLRSNLADLFHELGKDRVRVFQVIDKFIALGMLGEVSPKRPFRVLYHPDGAPKLFDPITGECHCSDHDDAPLAQARASSPDPCQPPGEGGGGPVKGSEGPKACPLTGEAEPPSALGSSRLDTPCTSDTPLVRRSS